MLSKVLSHPITFHPLTVEEQTQAMINVGLPESLAAMNAQAVARSPMATLATSPTTCRPGRTFEQFATDYAAAFS